MLIKIEKFTFENKKGAANNMKAVVGDSLKVDLVGLIKH